MTNRLDHLKTLLEESPNDSFLLFATAKEYEKLKDKETALQFYTQLQQSDPAYVGLYYHLGKLYLNLGKIEEALDTYNKGIAQAQRQGDSHALSELMGAKMEIDDGEEDFDDDDW